MARGQKSFKHKNNTAPVSDDEIYMMVMLYTYQHKSLDYLARKFNVNYFDAKEIISAELILLIHSELKAIFVLSLSSILKICSS